MAYSIYHFHFIEAYFIIFDYIVSFPSYSSISYLTILEYSVCTVAYNITLYYIWEGVFVQTRVFLATGKNQASCLGEVSIFERWKHRAAVKVTIFDDAERLAVAHPLPQEAFACKGNRLFLHTIEKRWLHFQLLFCAPSGERKHLASAGGASFEN